MHLLDQPEQIRAQKARKSSDDSNLIPLINVVFLLLIFFMVAGQIQPQDGSDIQPPLAESVDAGTPPVVDIQINRRNEVLLDGVLLSVEELKSALVAEPYSNAEHLLIKADRDVKAAELGALLDTLRSSGIGGIRLLTQKSGS